MNRIVDNSFMEGEFTFHYGFTFVTRAATAAGAAEARRGPPPSLRRALPPYSRHAQTRQARAAPDSRQGRAARGPSARRPSRGAAQSRRWSTSRDRLRRSAAGALRAGRRAASARPDRRDRHGRIAEDPARARRPQHPRPAGVDAAPAAAAGQVGGRPAVPDRLGIRAQGRPAARRSTSWSRASPRTSATRCCSASPARARPSPWPR